MNSRRCSALMLPVAAALCVLAGEASVHAGLPMRSRSSTPLPSVPASPAPGLTMRPALGPTVPPVGALTTDNYGINRDVVRRVIYVHINQVRHCYQQALSKQPSLAGRLVVIFEINPKGQVDELLIGETALNAPALLQCIGDTMRTWEFPPAPYYSGNVRIVYPFVLRPKVPEPPAGIEVSDEELAKLGIVKDPEPPSADVIF